MMTPVLALIIILEGGFMPLDDFVVYNRLISAPQFYTNMYAELVLMDTFFLGAGMTSYFKDNSDTPYMSPQRMNYLFTFGLRWEWLELGFRHTCIHPVVTLIPTPQPLWEGAYEEIYIRAEFKIDLIGGSK